MGLRGIRALALLAAAATAADYGADAAGKDMDSFLRHIKRPDTPNHWLIAPADFAVRPDAVAPVFEMPATALRAAFTSIVRETPGAVIADDTPEVMHVVATTRVFRFRDDVRAHFIALPGGRSTLALHSASRAGYWDLGANRRRLEGWLARLRKDAAAGSP